LSRLGLPYAGSYVEGQILFNTADSKLYRNHNNSWVKGTDPQDIIAGTIASGVT
jgi:hypothetical protein